MLRPGTIAALLLFLALPGCGPKPYAEFRIIPVNQTVDGTPGVKEYLLFRIEIPGKSYIYGNPKGPGTGRATGLTVSPTPFLVFGQPGFRPPEKHYGAGEKKHVWIYRHETEILLPVTVRTGIPPGEYGAVVTIEALVCSADTCMPEKAEIPVKIRVIPAKDYREGETAGRLKDFIFPSPPQGKHEIRSGNKTSFPTDEIPVFRPYYLTRGHVTGIIQGILFGLLAGFLLNFMPCVLPVVSLKVMGLVRHAREDRTILVRLGIAFTLGILASFAVLAALAAYAGYNWGELFQKKGFLVGMIVLIFALALSMFHVFSLPVPSFAGRFSRERDNPYADSFMKGLLATLLATPCSGPFLGGTLAWALAQPPSVIFIIFMSVGTGMAAPYLLLSVRPGLLRYIPKPGEWMVTFERVMAFLLLGTVVYLLGILEPDAVVPALWLLFFTGAGLWQFGRYGSPVRSRMSRVFSGGVLLLLTAGGWYLSMGSGPGERNTAVIREETFSLDSLYGTRDEGRISVVKFTADWCPNCKLVEARVLRSQQVVSRMREGRVRFFTADLTRDNPPAAAMLSALGSRSIPFLAVFPPGKGFYAPVCLRDIYSRSDVLKALDKARESAGGADGKK